MHPEDLISHKKLIYCNICEHRNKLENSFPTCKLTNRFAEFENNCINFLIDAEEFLRLKNEIKEDIIKTDKIERFNTDYYNDDSWVSYDFIKYEYPIRYIRLPDEMVIKQPFVRNVFITSFIFIIFFSISFGNLTDRSFNQLLTFLISAIIGFIPTYIAFKQLSKDISKIILNKEGIETKGRESVKYEWKEILFFWVKNVYTKNRGGGGPSRNFKMYFVSGYSETLSTENFLTDRKSADLLEWAYKYNQVYWNQFITDVELRSDSYNRKKPYSLFRISNKNSLYEKQIVFLKKALPYSLEWHDANWRTNHENSQHFVVQVDNSVIGCAVLMPDDKKKREAHILQFTVDINWRRKGVGKFLFNELIEYAKLKQVRDIYYNSMAETVPYFKRMNFEMNDETYDDGGILKYVMHYEIK